MILASEVRSKLELQFDIDEYELNFDALTLL